MINVEIQHFGRALTAMTIGAMKYQAYQKQKQNAEYTKVIENRASLKKENEMWNDLSFDITSQLIDKRFNSSKDYLKNRSGKDLKFKKTMTPEDKKLMDIMEQNQMRSSAKYNNAISGHNKRLENNKIRTSFKLLKL